MIRLMVFDMAGTTVDEDNVVYRTLHKILLESGYQFSLEDTLLHAAGKGKLQAFEDILEMLAAPAPKKRAIELHELFKQQLKRAYLSLEVKGFPSVAKVFQVLKQAGIVVALNTGYDRQTANLLLQKLGWKAGEQFDLLITNDDVERVRPYPDMIHLAMERAAISNPALVGKIGDSVVDIEEGKAAGCGWTGGITTGAQSRDQLAEALPDAILDRMDELLAHLQLESG